MELMISLGYESVRLDPRLEDLMRPLCTLTAFFLIVSGPASAEDGAAGVALTGLGGEQASITRAELDALPRVKISVDQHGATHAYEGALLGDVLAKVGVPRGKAIHGPEMADIVIVEARDGYRIALDLAGTDAATRSDRVILADTMDGAPLEDEKGPFQLVVEGDLRPARAVRMVSAIKVERVR